MFKYTKNKKIIKKQSLHNNSIKQAVILCGGLGTRLGKITKITPKPLIKIGTKLFLDYLIKKLTKYKLDKILLLCSFDRSLLPQTYKNRSIRFETP